jgi:hypothetical protein
MYAVGLGKTFFCYVKKIKALALLLIGLFSLDLTSWGNKFFLPKCVMSEKITCLLFSFNK